MKPLSSQTEARLVSAIRDACDLVENGESPNDALYKVAQFESFGPDAIRLLCIGYNTGAQTQQREDNNGLLKKIASFPLADAENIIKRLYPDQLAPKVANDQEYDLPPKIKLPPAEVVKSAAAVVTLVTPVTDDWDYENCLAVRSKCANDMEAARFKLAQARQTALTLVGNIGEYFKRMPYDRDWNYGEVRYAAQSRFGKAAEMLMDYVANRNMYTVKTASAPRKAVQWTARPFNWVENFVEIATELAEKQAVFNEAKTKWAEADHRARHFFAAAGRDSAEQYQPMSIVGKSAGLDVSDSVIGSSLVSDINKILSPDRDTAKMILKSKGTLTDPKQTNKIRGIRAQANLADLLANDSVLSGYDADSVTKAFNEISNVAPYVADNPAMLRPVLRRWMTQGGIESFESKELSDIEESLRPRYREVGVAREWHPLPSVISSR